MEIPRAERRWVVGIKDQVVGNGVGTDHTVRMAILGYMATQPCLGDMPRAGVCHILT